MAGTSASEKRVNGGTGDQEQEPGRKDKDAGRGRFDWGRFAGSLVTAIAVFSVAIVGGVINATISSAQVKTQEKIATAQLISDQYGWYANRETAVDSLRAQVFGSLAQIVVTELEDEEFKKVALLAAYHGNFSKFIDTRPVFAAFLREVDGTEARYELRRLAKRVARRQANYIEAHGGVRDRKEVDWGPGSDKAECVFNLRGHEKLRVAIIEVNDKGNDGKERPVDDVANTVHVVLDIDGEERSFSVSYLDAPYIDNIFLVHPDNEIHRIALLLLDISKTDDGVYTVTLEALHFPENSILPGDVPSVQEIQKTLGASDSHESQDQDDADSS